MKKCIGIVLFWVPLAAYAQQTYTNEDLKKFSVPGAYTNEDLKKLPPLPVLKGAAVSPAPVPTAVPDAEPYERRLDFLFEQRLILQSELEWRQEMVRKADSAFDKGTDGYPWPGYRSKSRSSIQYLEMQLSVVDARIERAHDEARRAGVVLELR